MFSPRHGGDCIDPYLDISNPLHYYFKYVWAERNLSFDGRGVRVCRLNGKVEYSLTHIFDFAIMAYQKHLCEGGDY